MKSMEGRGPKTETHGTPGLEEEGKSGTSDMEGNVKEKKAQTKQRTEEPMERVPKGEACRSGLKPTPLQGPSTASPCWL